MGVAVAIQPALAAGGAATACHDAAVEAERKGGLPPGILLAIGQVESGRRDPVNGRVRAWPWTINASGGGQFFDGIGDAVAETRALLGRGVGSVDVGCFQVNLLYHPSAFASVEEAFDPQANAAYAARFLLLLRDRTGSWANAVGAYHSMTPERGGPYRDRVLAYLADSDKRLDVVAPRAEQVAVWAVSPGTDRVRVWTPSVAGLAPRIISFRLASGGAQADLPVVRIGFYAKAR